MLLSRGGTELAEDGSAKGEDQSEGLQGTEVLAEREPADHGRADRAEQAEEGQRGRREGRRAAAVTKGSPEGSRWVVTA